MAEYTSKDLDVWQRVVVDAAGATSTVVYYGRVYYCMAEYTVAEYTMAEYTMAES